MRDKSFQVKPAPEYRGDIEQYTRDVAIFLNDMQSEIYTDLGKTQAVWDDVRVPVSAVRLGSVKPAQWTEYKNSEVLDFSKTNDQEIFFLCQMPHGMKMGTDIYPHVHWTPKTDQAASEVWWGLEYVWADIHSDFSNTNTIYAESSTFTNAADYHFMTEFTAISGSGITGVSSIIICRLFRVASDASDTYPDDVHFLEFDFHYEIDSVGSTNEKTK